MVNKEGSNALAIDIFIPINQDHKKRRTKPIPQGQIFGPTRQETKEEEREPHS